MNSKTITGLILTGLLLVLLCNGCNCSSDTTSPEQFSTPSTTPTSTPPVTIEINVQITKILYDGAVYRTESDEYVEITNLGSESVNLQGWRLIDIDEGYPEFTFPSYVLDPGESIRVTCPHKVCHLLN
jgi:hypothetical protein